MNQATRAEYRAMEDAADADLAIAEPADDGLSEEQREELEALRHRLRLFEPYLLDKEVQEIAVNEPGRIWLWKGGVWVAVECQALTLDYLQTVGRNLSTYAKKDFDRFHTSLSGHLPGTGERIEMTHPPTCPETTLYLNIRRHTSDPIPHEKFVDWGYYDNVRHDYSLTMDEAMRTRLLDGLADEERELWDLAKAGKWAKFMELAVKAKQNIVVSGATGTGKTTYLRSLVEFVPSYERIITAEDTPEMPLPNHPNNNRLLYRKGDAGEGSSAKDVLHSSMRKTPDRVFMAELRGDETMIYLSGVLASGHPGGMTTTHANSPKDAFFRLAMLIKQSATGSTLEFKDILMILRQNVNVVVQLKFDKQNGRRFIPAIYYDPIYRLSLLD